VKLAVVGRCMIQRRKCYRHQQWLKYKLVPQSSFTLVETKKAPFDIMRILQEAGGKAEKIVMSHLDRTIEDLDKLVEFAAIGCYCEYDLFGIETSHYQLCKHVDMPSDAQRIWRIKHLLDAGFEDKILIGQDIHTKHRLEKYGGHGYSHILNNVLPMMKIRGITEKQIDKMLVKNPAVWLTFE